MNTVDGEHQSSSAPSLADLSRNAPAVLTDSSDESPFVPQRPFSAPRPYPVPPYLSPERLTDAHSLAYARARSKSRARPSMTCTDDFRFGATLGEGSYSTVCPFLCTTRTLHAHPASRFKRQPTSLPVRRMRSRSSKSPTLSATTRCTPPLPSAMPLLL